MEFFRHCPNCGRRFHIVLEEKKLASVDREPVTVKPTGIMSQSDQVRRWATEQVIVDIEQYQYKYKCKSCGHEWTEPHRQEHKE